MRIRELSLKAYGPFTNTKLAFEDAGLHLIYGPNEAGKSSALRGLLSALYGMEDKGDAFVHDWTALRVGLTVQTQNGRVEIERRKGTGLRSLLQPGGGQPFPLDEWNRLLPVATRKNFEQMFGVNYERLVAGGRLLATGKGEIGNLLLAAAGDLGQILARKKVFEERADDLFRERATSTALHRALKDYRDAEIRFRQEKYTSTAYRNATRELQIKEEESAALARQLQECDGERNRLERLRQAKPAVVRLVQRDGDLNALSAVKLLAEDFAGRYANARSDLHMAEIAIANSQAEIERARQKVAGLSGNPAIVARGAEIERLFQQLGQIAKARDDRSRREQEVRTLLVDARRRMQELGLAAEPSRVDEFRITTQQKRRIGEFSLRHAHLEAELSKEENELLENRSDLRAANVELASLPAAVDASELERCLIRVPRDRQPEAELVGLQNDQVRRGAALSAGLASLALWRGTLDELLSASIPLPSMVREFAKRFAAQESRESRLRDEEKRLATERERLEQKMAQLERGDQIPTGATLTAARGRRDMGWAAIKHLWLEDDPGGAAETEFLTGATSGQPIWEAYADSVRDADDLADRLRREADRVQQKAISLAEMQRIDAGLEASGKATVQAGTAHAQLDAEWLAMWKDVAIEPRTPAEMEEWLELRLGLLTQAGGSRDLESRTRMLADQIDAWRDSIGASLQRLSQPTPVSLREAIAAADRVLKETREIGARRRDLESARRRLEAAVARTEQTHRRAMGAIEQWRNDWAAAIAKLPLQPDASPAEAGDVIEKIDEIVRAVEEIRKLEIRISGIEADEKRFAESVWAVAQSLGDADHAADPMAVIRSLNETLRRAFKDRDAIAASEKDLQRHDDTLQRARMEADRRRSEIAGLSGEAAVDAPERLQEAIGQSDAKRKLQAEVRNERALLLDSIRGLSIEELIAEVEALNIDEVPQRLKDLDDRRREILDRKAGCDERAGLLKGEFQRHEEPEAALAASADKQAAAARIEKFAEEYVEKRLGALLLTEAVDRYRRKYQDPLVQRAGCNFRALTENSFAGLIVDFDDRNQATLRGIRANSGEHLDLEAMSDGTCDQLFFALRLAYVEGHCAVHGPAPFVLDDVLMAFDDRRARAAFRVLWALSKTVQVLMFTHHRHHVELAKEELGQSGFALHELPGRDFKERSLAQTMGNSG